MTSIFGSLKRFVADGVVDQLGRRGYQLTRPRFHEENEIDLRAVLAQPTESAKGSFVVLQIGANDGSANDPIHRTVVDRRWTLYAVEPVPEMFAALERTYAGNHRVHPIQCAVGTTTGEATIYTIRPNSELVDGLSYDQFSSFSREVVERRWRYIPDVKDRIEAITVPALTLADLINTHEIPEIDMLQIDVEGYDFEIVKMAFEAGLTPPILAFEWVNLSQPDMWDCRTLLIENGYRWLIDKGDVIASRATLPLPPYVGE